MANRLPILLLAVLLLSACSTDVEEYRGSTPAFQLESYFDGDLIAYGMVQDYSNKLTRRFCVEINGVWQRQDGVLRGTIDEDFFFDDGEQSKRIWHLVRHTDDQGSHHYTGNAADVVGEASGRAEGSVFHWQYELLVPIKDDDGSVTEYQIKVDDWMYLMDERRLFNRSELIKFGLTVGQVTLFFEKRQGVNSCAVAA
ncbi:DUF3833 domain-containing protein [Corallincola spongiicola]|uniref:DUF3833 domain-containing protein n=1 Tax=Corallincola spongiicola TaxID=2520508 RepID=A0ABY1WQI4_9GAMM|nr:DUF3833 domain-containing protein [Corallincola spongiicola]TAA46956.1 DUF3833 domain-containing protein [Corallincola spongiicola]